MVHSQRAANFSSFLLMYLTTYYVNLGNKLMKITYKVLEEIIREEIVSILTEKKGSKHNCATHVKEISTGKLGEVISHSLTEDGSVEFYDVQFEDQLSENIPVSQLEVVNMVEHMHGAGKRDAKLKKHKGKGKYDDGDDKDEKCDHVPCKDRPKKRKKKALKEKKDKDGLTSLWMNAIDPAKCYSAVADFRRINKRKAKATGKPIAAEVEYYKRLMNKACKQMPVVGAAATGPSSKPIKRTGTTKCPPGQDTPPKYGDPKYCATPIHLAKHWNSFIAAVDLEQKKVDDMTTLLRKRPEGGNPAGMRGLAKKSEALMKLSSALKKYLSISGCLKQGGPDERCDWQKQWNHWGRYVKMFEKIKSPEWKRKAMRAPSLDNPFKEE